MASSPPPVLSSARVMTYAIITDDIPFTSSASLHVDGRHVGRVRRLAVCLALGEDSEALLLHCDEEWNVMGADGGKSVQALMARAESNYPGVSNRWVDVNTSIERALQYFDRTSLRLAAPFVASEPLRLVLWLQRNRLRFAIVASTHSMLRSEALMWHVTTRRYERMKCELPCGIGTSLPAPIARRA